MKPGLDASIQCLPLAAESSASTSSEATSADPQLELPVDSALLSWGRWLFLQVAGERGLRHLLSGQFDALARQATTLSAYFPEDPAYKDHVLDRQMPFFRKWFDGNLGSKDLARLHAAHRGQSRALGFDVRIDDTQFDEMKRVVDQDAGWWVRTFLRPSEAIEPFRRFVVSVPVHPRP
jgi:hypothetical protein